MTFKNLLPAIAALMFFLCSCSKTLPINELPARRHTVMLTGSNEPAEITRQWLNSRNEQLLEINRTEYLQTTGKYYTLVYYTSNTSTSNLLIEYQPEGESFAAAKSYYCTGSNCNCLVEAYVDNAGNIHISCTCSTCTMIISNI